MGCGEGADAIWLAAHGWEVTALDPSMVAIERGQRAVEATGLIVEWVRGNIGEAPLPHDDFDLVSAFYVPLLKGSPAVEALVSAVAPGGSLLVVHHADFKPQHSHIDPATLSPVQQAQLVAVELALAGSATGWDEVVAEALAANQLDEALEITWFGLRAALLHGDAEGARRRLAEMRARAGSSELWATRLGELEREVSKA